MKLKLAPGKIAVERIEAKLKGGIALPATRAKQYDIAKITNVGPLDSFGYEGKESTAEPFKPGDIILFQLPIHIAQQTAHKVKDTLNLFLNVADIIARMDSATVEMKSFHIVGRYVLLQPTVRNKKSVIVPGDIIIPDTADEFNKESLHFSVLQMGADVKIEVSKGQEVFPHKGRINPIVIDNEEVCFIDQQFIDGVMVNE